jgi:hypothetical protein
VGATSVQNLYRHKSGNYYGRFELGGKKKWIALKTKVFATAKLLLADRAKEIQSRRISGVPQEATLLTFDAHSIS